MKIELKRISHNERLSEETNCFAADVWINGKKMGDVRNAGHGGCNMYSPPSLETALDTYAKTLPPVDAGFVRDGKAVTIDQNADIVIGEILNAALAEKVLKRLFKTKLVLKREGRIYTVGPFKYPDFANSIGATRYVKDGDKVLNTLPMAEAVAAYRATH